MTTVATTIGAMAIGAITTMHGVAHHILDLLTSGRRVVTVPDMTWVVVPIMVRRKLVAIIVVLVPVVRRTWLSVGLVARGPIFVVLPALAAVVHRTTWRIAAQVARGPISAAHPVVVLAARPVVKVGPVPMDLAPRRVRPADMAAAILKLALPVSNGSWTK